MVNDPVTEEVKKFSVNIKTTNRRDLGTGTIVRTEGIIATCFHVIKNVLKHDQSNTSAVTFKIYFPSNPNTGEIEAKIFENLFNEKYDIAFLQLSSKTLPEDTKPAPLSSEIQPGVLFKSFGFRQSQDYKGLPAKGMIDTTVLQKLKKSSKTNEEKEETIEVIKLDSSEISEGMSGAPIYDTQQEKVVGIASKYKSCFYQQLSSD
jgi:hypothetical protein